MEITIKEPISISHDNGISVTEHKGALYEPLEFYYWGVSPMLWINYFLAAYIDSSDQL